MQDLIEQYKESLAIVKKARENCLDKGEYELLTGMISDLEYAIEWMSTGRRPGNRRGVERLAAYQRERPIDPIHIQRYVMRAAYYDAFEEKPAVTEWDIQRIEDALSTLTKLEREVYLMSRGHCLSYGEIANLIGLAKGTVQKLIERAEKKIAERKETSLFCVG